MTSKEWKICKIRELCSSISETYKRNDEKVILINTSDVFDGKILNNTSIENKNLKGQFKKTFKKDDILYSEIRPANRRFAYVDIDNTDNYIASTKLMVLRPNKNKVLSKYLYLILKSDEIIEDLQHLAETRSGTFPQITFNSELANIEILLPPLETQEKIVCVLSSLDDKIELNNKINQNLEQQAQAIYNQLILTQELKEKTLSEIIEITDGTHDSPKVKEEGYYLITSKHLSKYSVNKDNANYISEEDFNKINERSKVDKYDILMSMIGTVGLVSLIIEEDIDFAVKNVGIFKTSLQKDYIYFIFSYLLSSSTQNYIKSHLAGTTQKYISLGELRNLKIKIPNEKILASFNKLVHPIYQEIINNTNEIKILTQLRDTLLPKLMSGEIDVDKI